MEIVGGNVNLNSREQKRVANYTIRVRMVRSTSVPGNINCPSNACTASFQFNTIVTLNAEAILGSEFQGWSGACEGTLSTCQVVLDRMRRPHPGRTWAVRGRGAAIVSSGPRHAPA